MTPPPCHTALLHTASDYSVCSVHLQSDVRVKDVLDVADSLIEQGGHSGNWLGVATVEIVGCEYGWWQDSQAWMYGPDMHMSRELFHVLEKTALRGRLEEKGQVPVLRYLIRRKTGSDQQAVTHASQNGGYGELGAVSL